MTEFMQILNDLLLENNLNLCSFAKKVNITNQELYAYKNNDYYPSVFNAEKIAVFFDCSFDYLFGRSLDLKTTQYKEINISLFYPRYLQLLKNKGINHYYLHKTKGLNNSSITKWKNGSIPKFESLLIIANYFNTSLDYLVGRTDNQC